jgi:hypothetical protein
MAQQHELQVNPLSVVMPSRMLPSLDGGKLKGAERVPVLGSSIPS